MTEERDAPPPAVHIGGSATGVVITTGNNNQVTVRQTIGSSAEEADLSRALADLRAQVERLATPEQREAALGQVGAIESAVKSERPDVWKLSAAKSWFVKHLPAALGFVTSVVVHPLVGKLVEAAGDAAAKAMFGDLKS